MKRYHMKGLISLLIITSMLAMYYPAETALAKPSGTVIQNYILKFIRSEVRGIDLNKANVILKENGTTQLFAIITPWYAMFHRVYWSSDNTSVATVSQYGVIRGISAGSATITVSTADGKWKDTCQVTVIENNPITGISLNKSSTQIIVGKTETLLMSYTPENALKPKVRWYTDNCSIAIVNQSGTVTGIHSGTTKITVQTTDGKWKAVCEIKVVSLLDLARAQAHIDLQTAFEGYTEVDYSKTNWPILTSAKTDGDTAIDVATDLVRVQTALNVAKTAMDAVKTLAEEEEEALVAAKSQAHTDLQTAFGEYLETDFSTANWIVLTGAKTDGDTAIDTAADIPLVQIELDVAKAAMDAVKTLAEEEAEAALAAAKIIAKKDILDTVNYNEESEYSPENWIELNLAALAGYAAIDAATNITEVDTALGNAIIAVMSIPVLEEVLIQDKLMLSGILQSVYSEYDSENYTAENWILLTNTYNDGIAAINAATNRYELQNSFFGAADAMALVPTIT